MNIVTALLTGLFLIGKAMQAIDFMMTDPEFDKFLQSGSIKGYFTYEQFWTAYDDLRSTTAGKRYISDRVTIGKTYEGRDIHGVYLTDNTAKLDDYLKTKNIVLLDSLHHAREPIALTMVLLLFREVLKQLNSPHHCKLKEFFRDNVIFVIPILNVDSYMYIGQHFQDKNGGEVLMIRKNRHIDPSCDEISGGVDLNRNYDFKFGLDEQGSSSQPCQEDYRGALPFSEPETFAIKNYVGEHPNIASAVNMHSYGNAFIYPYGFIVDKSDHELEAKNKLFYDFFEEFKKDMEKREIKALFGNNAFALDYSTNGEAGDWFTGKKEVLGVDFELGNLDKRSEVFYPPKEIVSDIVRYNWLLLREFLYKHIVDLGHRVIVERKRVTFEVSNRALSSIANGVIKLAPIFRTEELKNEYKIEYCVKALEIDGCERLPVLGGEVETLLAGRHVLEVSFEFEEERHVKALEGLVVLIKRRDEFLDYGDQKYLFKSGL